MVGSTLSAIFFCVFVVNSERLFVNSNHAKKIYLLVSNCTLEVFV